MPFMTKKAWIGDVKGGEITIGADPEFFVTRNSQPFPICGLLGGTKQNPKPFHIGHVQEDNVMAEFNIPPAKTEKEFVTNVMGMRDQMVEYLKMQELVPEYCSIMQFPMEALDHPQAQNIGCEPDYNAYTYEKNPTHNYGTMGPFRTASFHVHIGVPQRFLDELPDFRAYTARLCDATILVPLMILGVDNHDRRQFYGAAGSFRPKSYGLEYRGAGGEVLRNKYYVGLVYRGAITAVNFVLGGRSLNKGVIELLQAGINSNSAEEAYMYLANSIDYDYIFDK